MSFPPTRSLLSAAALAALLVMGGSGPSAQAQSTVVLSDDVDTDFWDRVTSKAFGPGGLAALAEGNEVSLWDTSVRRLLGRVRLTPDPPNTAMPTRMEGVAFTQDGRLVLGTSLGLEVVSLRDTRLRQVVTLGANQVLVMESTADGVVVGFSSGDVVRFGGTPLMERSRFRLPNDASRMGSIALAGERAFVASTGRLFVYSEGALSEVPMGGTGARRDLAVGAGRVGEIIVAGGSHLARVSAQSHAVLGNATSEAGQTFQLSVRCNPAAQLCYWKRGNRVEVWRDDLSERVASGDVSGAVDAGTGRALQPMGQSSSPAPGAVALFAVATSVAGPWEPVGGRLDSVSDVAWSSRAGELILGIGGRAYALRVADLTLTAIGDTRAPIAVGSDGRVLTTGRLGEVIVHTAALTPQRTIVPTGCNAPRIASLEGVDTEAAWEQLTRLERQCLDSAPSRFAVSPSGTLVAMDTANGDLRWLDFQRGRWLERVPDFAGRGEDTDVGWLVWSTAADTVEARVDRQRYTVTRSGGVTSTVDASEPPSVLAPASAGGNAALSASVADGRLVLRRVTDDAELTLTFVAAHPLPLIIAQSGERFWAAPEAQRLVHVQASSFDVLAAELPSSGALDPQAVASFLAGAR